MWDCPWESWEVWKKPCSASVSHSLRSDTLTSKSKGNYERREQKKGGKRTGVEDDVVWGLKILYRFSKASKIAVAVFFLPLSCSFFPLLPSFPLLCAVLIGSGDIRPMTHSINTCKDILSLWSERWTKQLKHSHWQINWLWKYFLCTQYVTWINDVVV